MRSTEGKRHVFQLLPAQQREVLVVEDNLINRRFAVAMLEREGHRATAVESERAAVQKFTERQYTERQYSERQYSERQYDAILLDMRMPARMDTEPPK